MTVDFAAAHIVREIKEASGGNLGWLKGKSCIDVGCGSGIHSAAIAFSGASRVVGIDRSAQSLRMARKRWLHLNNLEFVLGDAERLPFASGSFDFVMCLRLIHHLSDVGGGLAELRRIAKPDGILYCGKST